MTLSGWGRFPPQLPQSVLCLSPTQHLSSWNNCGFLVSLMFGSLKGRICPWSSVCPGGWAESDPEQTLGEGFPKDRRDKEERVRSRMGEECLPCQLFYWMSCPIQPDVWQHLGSLSYPWPPNEFNVGSGLSLSWIPSPAPIPPPSIRTTFAYCSHDQVKRIVEMKGAESQVSWAISLAMQQQNYPRSDWQIRSTLHLILMHLAPWEEEYVKLKIIHLVVASVFQIKINLHVGY